MEWSDEGIVIGIHRHGESSLVLDVLTRTHGRHSGLVRAGRSKTGTHGGSVHALLQAGNTLTLNWRARLEEHLGTFTVEPCCIRAADVLSAPRALYVLSMLSALVRLLPERDPHPELYALYTLILGHLHADDFLLPLLVRFELALLASLGFGLDLEVCAATGQKEDLVFVSPKSARAVSYGAGLPYQDRLLPLPFFLCVNTSHSHASSAQKLARLSPSMEEVRAGFHLTGYFLVRHVFEPRGLKMPQMRDKILSCL